MLSLLVCLTPYLIIIILLLRRPSTFTLFPYTTLFRSRRPAARRSVQDLELLRDARRGLPREDRKSTRLNSSHLGISYAVFCLKKIIVIILLLHFLNLMIGSVMVLMLLLLV